MSQTGYWHVEVERKDGSVKVLAENVHNLLTNEGRDWIHAQAYTNTSAGTRGAGFIGVSTNATAPAAGDTQAGTWNGIEQTGSGLDRADAGTKTHTAGTNTTTLTNAFSVTGTVNSIQKTACLTDTHANGGKLVHEGTFAVTNVISGDTLTVTITITAG